MRERTQEAIGPATAADLPRILALLEENALPVEGLRDHLASTLVARADGGLIGCAAVEVYGRAGLLRSVAVAAARRGEGLGGRLTEAALGLARERGVKTLYLLTTTAGGFFPRFGFEEIDRADVDAAVRRSVEFATACPASALVMRAALEQ